MAKSCKNLVNFCRVTPEITGLIWVPRHLYLAKIDLHIAFVVLTCRNAMEYWNAARRLNSGNDQATPGINLVGFWSVYPEFTQINCVQEASINTWVSLSTFAGWQHSYVRYYLLEGDTVAPRGLYTRLCHAFVVDLCYTTFKGVHITNLISPNLISYELSGCEATRIISPWLGSDEIRSVEMELGEVRFVI